ncbi:hypothetical protein R69927_03261 [Paraburkholderia domus]|jgi:hypothetical protein|uniref:Uncharacterized protein n=1 Tax=Paraburkholderia domus TaxID=2793075 RepID=A0A9N8MMX0_9BURK|nr:hypothetical protein R75483_00861 [Paraburkholderia domus]CAE6744041.1 hypothetical protein R69749_00015 [Paraburkholderia domus]CAE6784473.1 hypothetical protein R70006_04564 [Paraburkholderia domus]CAE6865985.1 hypothetical protein R75471_00535 [Paraburkholderia domus]CAE6869711.1 hypothetical protein R69927_03261 [Paraburkholderia domus]
MCYSAQIEADYKKYIKMFGAVMSIREFAELYWEHGGRNLKAPMAMEAVFSHAQADNERRIQTLIAENNRCGRRSSNRSFSSSGHVSPMRSAFWTRRRQKRPLKVSGSRPTRSTSQCAGWLT